MLTWGDIKAAMIAEGIADTDQVFIGITVSGGVAPIPLSGFVVGGTVMHKPIEEVRSGVVS